MNIKREPGTNRHHNMSGKKQSLKEYQKINNREINKSKTVH